MFPLSSNKIASPLFDHARELTSLSEARESKRESQTTDQQIKVVAEEKLINLQIAGESPIQERKPRLQRATWTSKEDETLKNAVKVYGHKWTYIARNILPNKTAMQCNVRMNQFKGEYRMGKWSQAEDRTLTESIKKHSYAWDTISKEMGTRTVRQCRRRYTHLIKNNEMSETKSSIKGGLR
jgi:hypothetical protein